MRSMGRWVFGGGAVVVLVVTGLGVPRATADVDAGLWGEVRPLIEAWLVADSKGSGYGETQPALRARWFCAAEPLVLDDHDGLVKAGVNTLCEEYGIRSGALLECGGAAFPQVVRLKRDAYGRYRVVSRQEPPDDVDEARWLADRFGGATVPGADATMSPAPLEAAARTHFGLRANAPVLDC